MNKRFSKWKQDVGTRFDSAQGSAVRTGALKSDWAVQYYKCHLSNEKTITYCICDEKAAQQCVNQSLLEKGNHWIAFILMSGLSR